MDANVTEVQTDPQTDETAGSASERPPAPEGMVYTRRGTLAKRRKQSARSNKVFVVMQLLGSDGEVDTSLTKRNVKVLKTERSSDKVLEMIDSGEYDGAFYLRLDLAAK